MPLLSSRKKKINSKEELRIFLALIILSCFVELLNGHNENFLVRIKQQKMCVCSKRKENTI